jgi:hypothetical protein
MKAVTKDVFYRVIGPLNVHPRISDSKWDDVRGYTSRWTLVNSGTVIGESSGSGGNERYLLDDAYVPASEPAPVPDDLPPLWK